MSKKYDLHPTQINTWRKEFLFNASVVFEKEGVGKQSDSEQLTQALYAQIGELKVANDFLKKSYAKTIVRTPHADRYSS